ncbi:MAG: hypothetical protein JWO10_594, partial [Microbacteriaceae bacterium]|nr:hypothetical protein [Microbacteriaceae bacterium]
MERDRFHEITAVSAAGMEEAKRDVQEAIDA